MKVLLSSIERDTSIQCREQISMEWVDELAELISEGEAIDPVILFGTSERCWPGDGWHRIMAHDKVTAKHIDADLRPGTREDALLYALKANRHGKRRSPGDIRRAIEIAYREFPESTQQKIADMVGCSQRYVSDIRGQLRTTSKLPDRVTGADGKSRPTSRPTVRSVCAAAEREEAAYLDGDETEKEEEEPKRKEVAAKQRGSFADWQKLYELGNSVRDLASEMGQLRVDAQHKIPARSLCEGLSERFAKLAQKLVE